MKEIVVMICAVIALSSPAYAQFGNLLNSLKSNPLLAQQGSIKDVISKVQGVSRFFFADASPH